MKQQIMTTMKKMYVTPQTMVMEVETETLIAASGVNIPVRTGGQGFDAADSYSNGQRGSWGNLWDE